LIDRGLYNGLLSQSLILRFQQADRPPGGQQAGEGAHGCRTSSIKASTAQTANSTIDRANANPGGLVAETINTAATLPTSPDRINGR
jgi:hypothetical protein